MASVGSLFQCLHTLLGEMFPNVQSKAALVQHWAIPTDPVVTRGKSSALPCPSPLLRKLHRAMRVTLSFLFSRLDKPRALSWSSQDILPAPHHLCYPPLEAFKDFQTLLKLWGPEPQSAQEKVAQILNTDVKSPLCLFLPAGYAVFDAPQNAVADSPDTQGFWQMIERVLL